MGVEMAGDGTLGVAGGTYITEHDESVFFVQVGARDLSITFGARGDHGFAVPELEDAS